MRTPHSTLNAVKAGAAVGFGLLTLFSSSLLSADASQTETYTWSAELIQFDESSNTATVKARIVGQRDDVATGSLSEGDAAMLTWSGITRSEEHTSELQSREK